MFHINRSYFACMVAAAMVSGCTPAPAEVGPSPDGVDLRGSSVGGDFTLTANDGTEKSWSDFAGQYRLVYFGFAYCPDICPTDVDIFSKGLREFEQTDAALGSKVQPIFITIDPERDDVKTINEFVGNFHPRLIGLTGSREAIDQAITRFAVSARKGEPTANGGYDFEHTSFTYLFDPTGAPLGIIPTDKGPEGVAAELKQWVR